MEQHIIFIAIQLEHNLNILYTWDGRREIPKHYLDNLEITKSFYPDATIFFVTKNPISAPANVKIIDWNEYILKVIDYFKLDEVWRLSNVINASDWLRFYFLLQIPNLLYLDFDCKLLNKIPESDNFQFSKGNYCLLISPDNKDYQEPLKEILSSFEVFHATYGIYNKMIGIFEEIPREYFRHWS